MEKTTTKEMTKEDLYMHVETGSVDTKEGWIDSYPEEEREQRGLTSEEAFSEDEDETLFLLSEEQVKEHELSEQRRSS